MQTQLTGQRKPFLPIFSQTSFTHPRLIRHVLSERSIRQNRDVFFFDDMREKTFELCGGKEPSYQRCNCCLHLHLYTGLDSSRHNLTAENFYRWLQIVDDAPIVEFQLWHLNIQPYDIFTYATMRQGDPLSRSSTQPLAPGNYGAYYLKEESTGVLL